MICADDVDKFHEAASPESNENTSQKQNNDQNKISNEISNVDEGHSTISESTADDQEFIDKFSADAEGALSKCEFSFFNNLVHLIKKLNFVWIICCCWAFFQKGTNCVL